MQEDGTISIKALSRYNRLQSENTAEAVSISEKDDKFAAAASAAMAGRSRVPESHRRAADNYMVIKKIYGAPVVKLQITNEEKKLLAKYDFNTLEYSTINQINDEIEFLKRWAVSQEPALKKDADEIIQIRAKELKCLAASRYASVSNEMYSGYTALERYFEEISKYKF